MSLMAKNKLDNEKNQVREDFCPSCVLIPLALAGAGTAAVGANAKGKYQKYRKLMLWVGIIVTIVSLLLTWWFLTRCKQCSA
jgi:hypothetical protein